MGYPIDKLKQLFGQPNWMQEDDPQDLIPGDDPQDLIPGEPSQADDVGKEAKQTMGADVDLPSAAAAAYTSPIESFTDKSETSAISENFS